jgi:hypothetical protein
VVTNIVYGSTKIMLGVESGIWLTPVASAAGETPTLTALHGNHPNPFNPTIKSTLAGAAVTLAVFDAAGRYAGTLVTAPIERPRVTFDGIDGRNKRSQAVCICTARSGQCDADAQDGPVEGATLIRLDHRHRQ